MRLGDDALRGLLGALSVAGAAISAYLLYNHLAGTAPACVGGSAGCETVQTSRYSEIVGVPVAAGGGMGELGCEDDDD